MASAAKQASRWGSFLQQAVAGVESRLDTILADSDDAPKAKPSPPVQVPTAANARAEAGIPRPTSGTASTNDRLQERLARAVAAKNHASQKNDVQALSSNMLLRAGSPSQKAVGSRQTIDGELLHNENGGPLLASLPREKPVLAVFGGDSDVSSEQAASPRVNGLLPNSAVEDADDLSMETPSSGKSRPSLERQEQLAKMADAQENETGQQVDDLSPITESEVLGPQELSEAEISDLQRQEEIHGYIERIDALQAKLQYLSREATEAARKAATAAPTGSLERKLAEKDEQIAGLLEEGQKLSKAELKYMTTIKKLRSMNADFDREASEALKVREKAEKEKEIMIERVKRAEAVERISSERHKSIMQLQKDLDAVTADRDAKLSVITSLKAQLSDSMSQTRADEVRAAQDLLSMERKRVADLESELSSLKIERELAIGRSKVQIEDLRAKFERESERSHMAEMDMRREQQMLESRLEIMRTRAEEVSSGATGDAQAKLLRQVETLQSQYAIASENWQGIETSLTARCTALEKERDEALRREAEVRRKAREVTLKTKRNEDELVDARIRIEDVQQKLISHNGQLEKLQKRAKDAESALLHAKIAFEQERNAWRAEAQQRIEEERMKWRDDALGQASFGYSRADSPVASSRRGLTTEHLSLQNLQTRRASSRSATNEISGTERLVSRPSSSRQMNSGNGTPQRKDSSFSFNLNGDTMDATSIHTLDHDDYFENAPAPGSPQHIPHDMLSISTVGAGPSVQLVERMSAAVRRLESEKVSTREELVRLSSQRDEARAEIITLMQEVEEKRTAHQRVQELENEVKQINARYQTTLEMLGEKSELVEELRADVDDVKAMYRELVERTIR